MNRYTFMKDAYIDKNGRMDYSNFMTNVKLYVDTIWQRSAADNAKGFEFFAELWRTKGLKHRGVLERDTPAQAETKTESKQTSTSKSVK